jgi:hypothetical protein
MNPAKAGYWLITVLAALPVMLSGYANLSHQPEMIQNMAHLGFNPNFMTILGTWKILGGLAILVQPGKTLTDWAYAGLFFALTGAAWSHLLAGDGFGGAIAPLVFLGFAMLSRFLSFARNS